MAATLVDRRWRASTPEAVERDLASLWRVVTHETRAARAVMSNLVVFRSRRRSPAEFEPPVLDAVLARHPCRVVLIEHEHDPRTACAPIAARVGVSIFGPPTARYAVEQVMVQSACAEASLPSIVRRLTRGGLPTSIWWTEDLSQAAPLEALITMGRQLIYDSRVWRDVQRAVLTVARLTGAHPIQIADVNWHRLLPLRLALLHAAESGLAAIDAERLQIAHSRDDSALAWLLAGWLGVRLGWTPADWPQGPSETDGRPAEADGAPRLSITLEGPERPLTGLLEGGRATVTRGHGAPILVGAAETEADAVAGDLRSLSTDRCLHDALRFLARRFAGPGSFPSR